MLDRGGYLSRIRVALNELRTRGPECQRRSSGNRQVVYRLLVCDRTLAPVRLPAAVAEPPDRRNRYRRACRRSLPCEAEAMAPLRDLLGSLSPSC